MDISRGARYVVATVPYSAQSEEKEYKRTCEYLYNN
jgi:hypothetical protein